MADNLPLAVLRGWRRRLKGPGLTLTALVPATTATLSTLSLIDTVKEAVAHSIGPPAEGQAKAVTGTLQDYADSQKMTLAALESALHRLKDAKQHLEARIAAGDRVTRRDVLDLVSEAEVDQMDQCIKSHTANQATVIRLFIREGVEFPDWVEQQVGQQGIGEASGVASSSAHDT